MKWLEIRNELKPTRINASRIMYVVEDTRVVTEDGKRWREFYLDIHFNSGTMLTVRSSMRAFDTAMQDLKTVDSIDLMEEADEEVGPQQR